MIAIAELLWPKEPQRCEAKYTFTVYVEQFRREPTDLVHSSVGVT
jgi:hypothetical protein